MAEDSGTFKTNPRNSAQFQQFVMFPEYRCNEASPVNETFSDMRSAICAADF
jgi:hypothetical protein